MKRSPEFTPGILTQKDLKEELDYDYLTGIFTRRNPWKIKKYGLTAGWYSGGYEKLFVRRKLYLAHRLAWLWYYGKFPSNEIDHIDGNRRNNRISNLRDVSRSVNNQNRKKANKRNQSGLLGVAYHKPTGLFRAIIGLNRKYTLLGYYDTPEEAHAVYLEAKRQMHEGNML